MENKKWQRALELQKNHQHEDAIKLFNALINKKSKNPDLLHDRGVSYFHIKKQKESIADFELAAKLQPEYAYRYSSMAFIKAAFKLNKEALRDYQKAVEIDPTDAVTQNNLGLLEEQMGWQKESQDRFKIADELAGILKDSDISSPPPIEKVETKSQPQPQSEPDQSNKSLLSVAFGIFKSKKEFKEFTQFLRNGFTFKKNKNNEP